MNMILKWQVPETLKRWHRNSFKIKSDYDRLVSWLYIWVQIEKNREKNPLLNTIKIFVGKQQSEYTLFIFASIIVLSRSIAK